MGGRSCRHGVQKTESPEGKMPHACGKTRGLFWRGQCPFRKESELALWPEVDQPWTRPPCSWNPTPSLGQKGKPRVVQGATWQGLELGLEPRSRATPSLPLGGMGRKDCSPAWGSHPFPAALPCTWGSPVTRASLPSPPRDCWGETIGQEQRGGRAGREGERKGSHRATSLALG